jgi:opacity protein-like surface antigen
MRNLILAAGAALIPLAFAGQASADDATISAGYDNPGPVYIQLTAGSAQSVDVMGYDADGELAVGGAVGVRFGDLGGLGLRLQGEFNRYEASGFGGMINGDVSNYGVSALLDFPIGSHFSLVGGGGLHLAQGSVDNWGSEDGDGYHYLAQAEYDLSDGVAFVAGYRNDSDDFDGLEVDAESLYAGLRFAL